MKPGAGETYVRVTAVVLIFVVLAAGIIYYREAAPESGEGRVIDISDVLDIHSIREADDHDMVLIEAGERGSGIVATPVACWYDISDGTTGLVPLLVEGEPGVTRFIRLTGRGNPSLVKLDEDVFSDSSEIARRVFNRAGGVMLVSDDDEGYGLGLSAGVISSYLNIPVVMIDVDTGHDELNGLIDDLGCEYLIPVGGESIRLAKGTGLDYIPVDSWRKALSDSAIVVEDRFGRLDYITMTNPGDTIGPDIVSDVVDTQVQDVNSVFIDSSRIGSFGLRFCEHRHWVKFDKMS